MENIVKFIAGNTYIMTFVTDAELEVPVQVLKRTAKRMTVRIGGQIKTIGIKSDKNEEYALPCGRYSMAPRVRASSNQIEENRKEVRKGMPKEVAKVIFHEGEIVLFNGDRLEKENLEAFYQDLGIEFVSIEMIDSFDALMLSLKSSVKTDNYSKEISKEIRKIGQASKRELMSI